MFSRLGIFVRDKAAVLRNFEFASIGIFVRDKVAMLREDKYLLAYNTGVFVSLLGVNQTDIAWLRGASIFGGCTALAFAMTRKPNPNTLQMFWTSCFLMVNSFEGYKLIKERVEIKLSDPFQEVYRVHFEPSKMKKAQFRYLVDEKNVKIKEFKAGYPFTEYEVENKGKVWLLISGDVKVTIEGEEIATISAKQNNCFIGELDLLKADLFSKDSSQGKIGKFKAWVGSLVAKLLETINLNANQASGNSSSKVVEIGNEKGDAKEVEGEVRSKDRATCTAINDVVALEWDRDFLLKILNDDKGKSMAISLHNVLLSTLLFKFESNLRNNHQQTYFVLLTLFVKDGQIDPHAKKVFENYRKNYKICNDFHKSCLQRNDWTTKDWALGSRQAKYVNGRGDRLGNIGGNDGSDDDSDDEKDKDKEERAKYITALIDGIQDRWTKTSGNFHKIYDTLLHAAFSSSSGSSPKKE